MKQSSRVLALFFLALSLFIATSCRQKSTNDNPAASRGVEPTPQPMITAVYVSFWSINDDKDPEEKVEVWIENQNGTIHANNGYGKDEKWDEEEDGGKLAPNCPFTMNLSPQVPLSDSGRLRIRVYKHPVGSATGKGWSMAVGVTARVSDGRDVTLLSRTDETRMGDGNQYDRKWNFQSVGL